MNWSHPMVEAVARLVTQRTGLTCPPARRERIEEGIRQAMAQAAMTSLQEYYSRIAADPVALDNLVGELTIGETYFFREPAHFDFIRREVLPELRNHGAMIRAWSAGCASGEEAYSLAMLFETEGLTSRSRVLATDVSRTALARARQGHYSTWSLRGDGAVLALPFLSRQGDLLVVDEKVRRRVVFDYLNLAADCFPSQATGTWDMDLILCRNVLIYFEHDTVDKVANRLARTLAPGGWLLTASSDPPLQDRAPLQAVVREGGVFYRRTESPVPRAEDALLFVAPASECNQGTDAPPALPALPAAPAPPPEEGAATLAERVRTLAVSNAPEAERRCAAALARFPLDVTLQYLHGVLLMDLGRGPEAEQALRRALYLDHSLAVVHFTLGSLLAQRGDRDGARRAYRNAREHCRARPPDEPVPLGEGETAGRLGEAAAFQLELVDAAREVAP